MMSVIVTVIGDFPDGADTKVPIIIDPPYDHNIQVPVDIDTQVYII